MYHETKIWSAFLIGHLVDGDSNILLLSAAPPSGGNIYNGLLYANFKWKAQELRCFGLYFLGLGTQKPTSGSEAWKITQRQVERFDCFPGRLTFTLQLTHPIQSQLSNRCLIKAHYNQQTIRFHWMI